MLIARSSRAKAFENKDVMPMVWKLRIDRSRLAPATRALTVLRQTGGERACHPRRHRPERLRRKHFEGRCFRKARIFPIYRTALSALALRAPSGGSLSVKRPF